MARGDPVQALDAMLGEHLGSKYHLRAVLGRGGMGAVFLAKDTFLDRDVAVKVILPQLVTDEAERVTVEGRFLREARATARLKHEGIVVVHDFGRDDARGMLFLVMELLQGRDLGSILGEGRLAPRRVVRLGCQVAAAMAVAHAEGVIHRDLKPSNLYVTESLAGELVKVVDFGLARALHGLPGQSSSFTRTGTLVGTPHYMSPEQINRAHGRAERPDGRSDIYSLGCVLYHLLAGKDRPPFTGPLQAVLAAHVSQVAPPVAEIVAGVPASLSDVIARAMAKRPGERYRTMKELAEALDSVYRPAPPRPAEAGTVIVPPNREQLFETVAVPDGGSAPPRPAAATPEPPPSRPPDARPDGSPHGVHGGSSAAPERSTGSGQPAPLPALESARPSPLAVRQDAVGPDAGPRADVPETSRPATPGGPDRRVEPPPSIPPRPSPRARPAPAVSAPQPPRPQEVRPARPSAARPRPPSAPPAGSGEGRGLRVLRSGTLTLPCAGAVRVGRPVLLPDGSGVVLEHGSSGRPEILLQALRADGRARGTPVPLTRSPGGALAPAAALSGGEIHLAWADTRRRDGLCQIYAGHAPLPPSVDLTEAPVATTGLCGHPAIAVAATGVPVVAWQRMAPDRVVCATALRSGGQSAVQLGRGSGPSVAAAGDAVIVAWHAGGTEMGTLLTCVFRREQWSPVRPLRLDGCLPALATSGTGLLALAYWSGRPEPELRLVRFSEAGDVVAGPLRLGPAGAVPERAALIADEGGFVAAWAGPTRSGTAARPILLATVTPDLSRASDPLRIEVEGSPTHPALARRSESELLLAWHATAPAPVFPSVTLAQVARG